MKSRMWVLSMLALMLGASFVWAADEEADDVDQFAIAEAVAPSLVRVEYTLQYDKGEAPSGSGWRYRCPNCGGWHGFNESEAVEQERPLEAPGFLLSPTRVITSDMMMHPRFVKSIAVRFGDKVVSAKPAGIGIEENAAYLELAEPLEGAKPISFDPSLAEPYFYVTQVRTNGFWTVNVGAIGKGVNVREDGKLFYSAPNYCLIVDGEARPVGMSMTGKLPKDGSWKGSPTDWPMRSTDENAAMLKRVEDVCEKGVLRVALSFRSPKKDASSPYSRYYGDDDEGKTERDELGLLLPDGKVMVLANLKPNVTARLQRITVHTSEGKQIPVEFECTLKDYGCFLARLSEPMGGAIGLSPLGVSSFQQRALPSADITQQGQVRTAYFKHRRIPSYDINWRSRIYPEIAPCFLFDEEARLVALPLCKRDKTATESWRSREEIMTPVAGVQEAMGDLVANIDASNIPLTEEQENRLAWLGVELQPLDRELARANKVSDLSRDGEIGALVSYVYPGSPAEQAGIEVGYILLRVHVEDLPQPIEVQIERYGFADRPFPWDQLDNVPEQYFDQIPLPWPPAENTASRALTDLGFGTKFQAEFFHDGQVVLKDSEVVESPPHYDSAARSKSDLLGLTVRDLTYEVRRYFHKADDEPGVIVSKIEPGSKASVAGVRPYEIITHVNDKPVASAAEFASALEELATAGWTEPLRLSVKRMAKGRIVRIKIPSTAASSQPAAEEPAGSADGEAAAEVETVETPDSTSAETME